MNIEKATAETANATIGNYRNHLDETKRGLAKLLARENITVRHENTSTAMFDVQNRVLVLPKWDNVTVDQYDLLIGHEVGHAKYSSGPESLDILEKCRKFDGLHTYLNVLEDTRIERLMKDEYPGLRASFRRGYADFAERGPIFQEDPTENLASYSFIDRINMQYKVGAHRDVPFTDAERALFPRIDSLESMTAAFELAKELYDADVQAQKETPKEDGEGQPSDSDSDGQDSQGTDSQESDCDGDGNGQPSDGQEIEPGLDGDDSQQDGDGPKQNAEDSDEGESHDGESGDGDADNAKEGDAPDGDEAAPVTGENPNPGPVAKTDMANKKALESLANTSEDDRSAPVEVDLRPLTAEQAATFEVSYQDDVAEYFATYPSAKEAAEEYLERFNQMHGATIKFMAREFELKKAARLAERAKTSRTGRLDVTKLYAYKFREDLFKTTTVLPTGKSHGVVVVIDGSGSMNDIISDALDQALLFGTFAKAVGIPFKAVVFSTNRYSSVGAPRSNERENVHTTTDMGAKTLTPTSGHLQLATVLDTSAPKWKDQLIACAAFAKKYDTSHPNNYECQEVPHTDLGSTPLYSTLLVAEQYIAAMKSTYRLDKTTLLIVTDGDDSSGLDIEYGDKRRATILRKGHAAIIRDTVTRKVYADYQEPTEQSRQYTSSNWYAKTNSMLAALIDSIQSRHDTRVVTIKVLPGRDSRYTRRGGSYGILGKAKQFARTWDTPSDRVTLTDYSFDTVGVVRRFSITEDDAKKSMKEHGQVAFKSVDVIGDAAILVSAKRLRLDADTETSTEGMTPAQIKRAFVKHSVGASKNKVFVQTVMPFLA